MQLKRDAKQSLLDHISISLLWALNWAPEGSGMARSVFSLDSDYFSFTPLCLGGKYIWTGAEKTNTVCGKGN